jgi:hypothetical protein
MPVKNTQSAQSELINALAKLSTADSHHTIVFQVPLVDVTHNDPWVNVPFHVNGLVVQGGKVSKVTLNRSRLNWTTKTAQVEWNKRKAKSESDKAGQAIVDPASIY